MGLVSDATYSYKVRARNAIGTSGWSAPVNGRTALAVPTGLRIVGNAVDALELAWNTVPGADSYALLRDGHEVYSGSSASYTDTGLTDDTMYSYTLYASQCRRNQRLVVGG